MSVVWQELTNSDAQALLRDALGRTTTVSLEHVRLLTESSVVCAGFYDAAFSKRVFAVCIMKRNNPQFDNWHMVYATSVRAVTTPLQTKEMDQAKAMIDAIAQVGGLP